MSSTQFLALLTFFVTAVGSFWFHRPQPEVVRTRKLTIVDQKGREAVVFDVRGIRFPKGRLRLEPGRLLVEAPGVKGSRFRTEVSAAGLRVSKFRQGFLADETFMDTTQLKMHRRVEEEGGSRQFGAAYGPSAIEVWEETTRGGKRAGRCGLRLDAKGLDVLTDAACHLLLRGRNAEFRLRARSSPAQALALLRAGEHGVRLQLGTVDGTLRFRVEADGKESILDRPLEGRRR